MTNDSEGYHNPNVAGSPDPVANSFAGLQPFKVVNAFS